MQATIERLEPFTPAMPISHIMANFFQKFIKYWMSKSEVKYLGELQEWPVDMPVERCVRWNGNARGMVVFRCYEGFVKWLKENKGYKPLNFGSENEMLNEMVGLYCTYVINNFWRPELLKIGPILTKPCTLEEWPTLSPDAAFSLLVEGNPVEIRLWMD